MPCMDAKPKPNAIEHVLDFMIGDEEDVVAWIMRDGWRRHLIPLQHFYDPMPRDIQIHWIEYTIQAHHSLYLDFTALRLERARVLAQQLENFIRMRSNHASTPLAGENNGGIVCIRIIPTHCRQIAVKASRFTSHHDTRSARNTIVHGRANGSRRGR